MFKQLVKVTWIGILLNTVINFSGLLIRFDDFSSVSSLNSEINYEIKDLVKKHGYIFENFTVQTEDGYLLELHRISSNNIIKKNENNKTDERPVIFLVHGILVSSMIWVLDGPQKALAYKLSNNGYDVWMLNCRGNKYSKKHVNLDPVKDSKQFFDFTWHEIGYYDLPASIDFIMNVTGHNKITYMGHSQGCTAFFVMLSEKPHFNNYIERMVAMAPVVYSKEASCAGFLLARKFLHFFQWSVDLFAAHAFMEGNVMGSPILSRWLCSEKSLLQFICRFHYSILGGHNPDQLNTSNLDMIYEHFPSGSASKQFIHYLQISSSDVFRQYDFGVEQNLIKYNEKSPPEYNFDNIQVPIALYYGNNDFFSSQRDIDKLYSSLPNVVKLTQVSDDKFTHFNFMFGKTTHKILYDKIIGEFLNT